MMHTNYGANIMVKTTDPEMETGNVYVSLPTTHGDAVWTMADWFKSGPFTMPAKNGRFAAKFTDVYVDDVDALINFLNRAH